MDEGINQFESFVRDRFHYRLAINKKYYYFDCRFLNSSHRPAAEVQPSDVIDTFELEESSQDYRINVTNQQNDKTKWLSYRFRDKTGKVESNQLASMDEVERVQVKFLEDDAGIGFLIYYDQHNDETNKTIWLLHFAYDGSHSTQLHYSWKTSSARRAAQSIQIIPQSSSEFYFLYYDTFNKANYSTDQRFVNFNADSMLLPYVGLYPVLIANNPKIKTYLQTPVFCAPDYAGQWDQKLSTYLVDAYRATSERGTSFYFLLDNRFDQSQTVCVMNPQELASAFGTNAEFLCDDTRNDKCTPKKPPLIDVVLRFEKSAYQRILVKQFYDQNTQLETSILFLLEKDFKQQLVIYNLIQKGNETGKSLCFEGIYKLRSQKELILDIQLENKTDSLLIITRNYIQRIPIGSFCTANSFSSCQSASTCTLRNSTCQNPERFKSGCLDPSKLPKSKMTSEEYMCDRETRDACLTGQVKPQTKANYQGKLCNEDSCLCQVGYLLGGGLNSIL